MKKFRKWSFPTFSTRTSYKVYRVVDKLFHVLRNNFNFHLSLLNATKYSVITLHFRKILKIFGGISSVQAEEWLCYNKIRYRIRTEWVYRFLYSETWKALVESDNFYSNSGDMTNVRDPLQGLCVRGDSGKGWIPLHEFMRSETFSVSYSVSFFFLSIFSGWQLNYEGHSEKSIRCFFSLF